jgi:arginyl-tRNA synthetase
MVTAAPVRVLPAGSPRTDPLLRRSDRADYQSAVALVAARAAGLSPVDLAGALAREVPGAVTSGPGFLNLTVPDGLIWSQIVLRAADSRLGVGTPLAGSRTGWRARRSTAMVTSPTGPATGSSRCSPATDRPVRCGGIWWPRRGSLQPLYERLGVLLVPSDDAPESTYNPRLESVVSELAERGIAMESQGAWCVFPAGSGRAAHRP